MTARALTPAVLAVVLLCSLAVPGPALEGKWTPEQVLELDPAWLRDVGLEIPPERLWGPDGAGLLDATVRISGCTAAFVSPDGLMITNHHCAMSVIQEHSTPERDLLTLGFLAAGRAEELPARGIRATLPLRTRDVTAEVEGAVPAGADDLARFRAIERRQKELVAACEAEPNRRCQVEAFDGGVRYLLFENVEYPDVRLVWAPPGAVGDYGGEIDNWSWPRHTGDFTLLRVWAAPDGSPAERAEGNAPLAPRHWFPLAAKGPGEGDFVMVPGYPFVTFRSFLAAEMAERAEFFYPRRAEVFGVWLRIMERFAATDDGSRIALADRIRGLGNYEKNARGQIAGLARGAIVEKRQAADAEVRAWAAARPEWAGAVAAHDELARLAGERRAAFERGFLLENAGRSAQPLGLALTLARWAGEKAKPDLEREPDYMERNRARVAERLERAQSGLHAGADAALLADWLDRAAALPAASRIAAVDALLGEGGARAAETKARELLGATKVGDAAERARMFDESAAELAVRRDPLLDLAFALDAELRAQKERDDAHRGAISRLRPAWRRAVAAHRDRPLDPDANGTLRVSFATVQGYAPRDGIWMKPQTTVAGMAAKHTGEAPFAAPAALLAAAPAAPGSRWADPRLDDVPVAFLADADTTGGNSGSPVVNGRGELVGVNFDRVWENVANDFGFNPEIARNVAADTRYLLWILETLHGPAAGPLLAELGIAGRGE
ncbi:MAG: S46 family peptidase [Thermoanaerobaculia bacterium]|nr:S46 family peptidase [Thermoanaerobaculia bacterium]